MTKEPLNRCDWAAGLEKGLAILEAFDHEHPRLTPTQAVELTSLIRTAVRCYLLTLERLDYLTNEGTLFSLMSRVLKVGWSYFDSARLSCMVQPLLQQVTVVAGEVVYLSVLDDWELVFISRTSTSRVMSTRFVLGAHVPIPFASTGVMMPAVQPEQKVKAWLETCVLTLYMPYTILQWDRLLDEIRKAGWQDYAVVEQQLQIGVWGVAVLLCDRHGNTIAVLSVNMQVGEEITEHVLQRVLQVLQDIALSIMRVL